jgi:hypothetical protein
MRMLFNVLVDNIVDCITERNFACPDSWRCDDTTIVVHK